MPAWMGMTSTQEHTPSAAESGSHPAVVTECLQLSPVPALMNELSLI